MSIRSIIKQYALVIDWLKDGRTLTRSALMNGLEEQGFTVSARTFDRLIQSLRDEFGFAIEYNTTQKGYRLLKEHNDIQTDVFLKLAAITQANDLLMEAMRMGYDVINRVAPETHQNYSGMVHFETLLQAVLNSKMVKFTYKKFAESPAKTYEIQPYLLKEYQGRWYLIGFRPERNWLQTFGLERIVELKISSQKFKRNPNIQTSTLFDHIIGINSEHQQLTEVKFSAAPIHKKYLETLPLHPSQKLLETKKDGTGIFSIQIIVNYEFKQQMLGMGSLATILQPDWLVKEIKEELKKTLTNYK